MSFSQPLITRRQARINPPDQIVVQSLPWEVHPDSYQTNINLKYSLRSNFMICSLCFNNDGSNIIFSSQQNVYVISTQNGSIIRKFDIPNMQESKENSRSIVVSPDSRYLALGSPNNQIIIYSMQDGQIICIFEGHSDCITSLLFSNDSNNLYSGSFDRTVCIWDLQTMKLIKQIQFGGNNMITSLNKDKFENTFFVSFLNGHIEIFNQFFTNKISEFKLHDKCIFEISTSNFDESIATSSFDNTIKIWNLNEAFELKQTLIGHNNFVLSTCFSPIESICFSASKDNTIKAWNYIRGDCYFTLNVHNNTLCKIVHHPTDKIFASCSIDGVINLWSYNF